MSILASDTTFTPSPDIQVRILDGEAVLLNIQTGAYFGANKVATLIWELYAQGLTMQEVTDRIVERFEVDQARAEADVRAFTQMLLDKGLLAR